MISNLYIFTPLSVADIAKMYRRMSKGGACEIRERFELVSHDTMKRVYIITIDNRTYTGLCDDMPKRVRKAYELLKTHGALVDNDPDGYTDWHEWLITGYTGFTVVIYPVWQSPPDYLSEVA